MRQYRTISSVITVLLIVIIGSCQGEPDYTPKPKGYFVLELPEKDYQRFEAPYCPYSFEYPTYAQIDQDTLFFNERVEDPCWLDITIPELAGEIHLSYKEVGKNGNNLGKLIDDAHKMSYKHSIKADYIDESFISRPEENVSGIMYLIGGDAASNIQFYVTDSTQHFLRGSLYFGTTPNADSLAPVIKFVREDLLHLIGTLEWESVEG